MSSNTKSNEEQMASHQTRIYSTIGTQPAAMVFRIKNMAEIGSKFIAVSAGMLSLSALLFPFSVAATNVALALTLVLGLLSGLWWQGARACWENYKLLTIVICIYLAILVMGLLWSLDPEWGMHVLGRNWFWLLIPAVVGIASEKKWRDVFLVSLSSGLALNLGYCVLQMFGLVELTTDGSSATDATGHIGHIGFGFVYGIWAAWLFHLGLMWRGWQRFTVWGLAAWSYVMIFSAQGRSGYVIAVVLILCVCIKWLFDSRDWRAVVPLIAAFVLISLVVFSGPGKERLQGTWLAFTQTQQQGLDALDSSDNAILATDERFSMWKTSIDIWHMHPVLGVGTGGLPKAADTLREQGHSPASFTFVHPHNQFLLNLIRWGPVGLLALLVLWFVWIREGIVVNWQCSLTAPLFTLTGLALAVHGLSSSSMEEHFSAILAVLLLGMAMSGNSYNRKAGGKK